ncbi:hypothetical protein [uncultured Cocleimonas sp.]|uniref:hypothetical protein n=1 Tax=uncultured Cocleimonas sp. TaxID=1051587 RepID=UPI002634236F|nr:hypothetical protein [uncultured Cocleimonas sp.]
MDAEILFLMMEKDESEFLAHANDYCDSIDIKEVTSELHIGDCKLLFTHSVLDNETLFCGKLEIRLGREEYNCTDHAKAMSVFRKLRNYIKKGYWSRLAYNHQNKKGKLTPSRNHWLGPEAKKWKDTDSSNHILKLSKTSWMEFDIGF